MSDGRGNTRSDIEEHSWVLFGLIYGGTKELDNYPNEIINDGVRQQTGNPLAQLERLFGDTKPGSQAFVARRAGRKLILAQADGRGGGPARKQGESSQNIPFGFRRLCISAARHVRRR